MSTVFFTDSCWDMPDSYAKERSIQVIPLTYKIGDREIISAQGDSMTVQEFYTLMRQGQLASTSQATPYAFAERFRPVLEAGDDIFYIGFSSGLSASFNSAQTAWEQLKDEFPDRKAWLFDSRQASMGQGLMVHYALNMRDEGKSPQEIYDWLGENYQHFCAWFTVLDLANLRRGGRVSATAAFFGTMLNIKPVLHVDDAGHLIPMEKVKGRNRALSALVDHFDANALGVDQPVFISHADDEASANVVANMLRERGVKDITIYYIGPVIGAHTGPDTTSLFFFGKNRS